MINERGQFAQGMSATVCREQVVAVQQSLTSGKPKIIRQTLGPYKKTGADKTPEFVRDFRPFGPEALLKNRDGLIDYLVQSNGAIHRLPGVIERIQFSQTEEDVQKLQAAVQVPGKFGFGFARRVVVTRLRVPRCESPQASIWMISGSKSATVSAFVTVR